MNKILDSLWWLILCLRQKLYYEWYCCNRPDHIVSGRTVDLVWNFGLGIEYWEISELFSGSLEDVLRAIQTMEAWLATFQREEKTLLGHLYEDSVVSGQLQLRSQLWVIRGRNHQGKTFLFFWENGCWSAGAEKLVVIKKKPALLKQNLLGSVSLASARASCI